MKNKKEKILAVKISDTDLKTLKAEAEKERISMSSYVRQIVFKSLQKQS
jgi:predicted DNA binding CopG/RHH family protein